MQIGSILRSNTLRRLSDYSPPEADARLRTSLKHILMEGVPADIVLRIFGTFTTPLALALRATAPQIGLLTAVPYALGAVAQLMTHNLVGIAGSRRRFFLVVIVLGAFVWLPIALLPWVFGAGKVWWLLGFVTLAFALFQLPAPAWGSWVAQLVPANRLGRFVGARATLATVVGVLTMLALGRFLDMMHNHLFLGFSLVFFGALLSRLVSVYFIARVYEPPIPKRGSSSLGLWASLRSLAETDLGHFTGINAFFHFCVNIAGPFFYVLMLRDLGFSYTTVTLLQLVTVASGLVGLQVLGPLADRIGNVRVMRISIPLIAAGCLAWLFNQTPLYLIGVEVVMGFAWAGYNLGSLNFALEASSEEERTKLVGYFHFAAGIGIALGAVTGGFLATRLPVLLPYRLLTLIMLSGVLRLGVGLLLMAFVHDVRQDAETPRLARFRIPRLRVSPLRGLPAFSRRRR
jgi:MFS family permease